MSKVEEVTEIGTEGKKDTEEKKCALCGVVGSLSQVLLKCSRCKKVFYCSKDHQRQHWKKHKKTCIPFAQQNAAPSEKRVEKKVEKKVEQKQPHPNENDESSAEVKQGRSAAQPRPKMGLVSWANRYHAQLRQLWTTKRTPYMTIWSISPPEARIRLMRRVVKDITTPDLSPEADDPSNLFHVVSRTFEGLCPELCDSKLVAYSHMNEDNLDQWVASCMDATEEEHFKLLCDNKETLTGVPVFVGMGTNKRRIDFNVSDEQIREGVQRSTQSNMPHAITIFLAVRRVLIPRFWTEVLLHMQYDESF